MLLLSQAHNNSSNKNTENPHYFFINKEAIKNSEWFLNTGQTASYSYYYGLPTNTL